MSFSTQLRALRPPQTVQEFEDTISGVENFVNSVPTRDGTGVPAALIRATAIVYRLGEMIHQSPLRTSGNFTNIDERFTALQSILASKQQAAESGR